MADVDDDTRARLINPSQVEPDNSTSTDDESTTETAYSSTTVLSTKQFRVYKRRWYILLLFVAMNIIYNMYWNTFGPIQGPLKLIFHWEDWNILLVSAWAGVALTVASPPMGWLMEAKGLRIAVIVTCFFLVAGKALQALPYINPTADTILLNAGQFVAFMAGPVSLGAPTMLSASWFPARERTTATALGSLSSYLGIALAFVIGPHFVPDIPTGNDVTNNTKNSQYDTSGTVTRNISNVEMKKIKLYFKEYIYFELAVAIFALLCVLIYFPSKPKAPPSRSSTEKRHHFSLGMKRLVCNRSFWLLAILFALEFGVIGAWLSILDVILSKYGIEQTTAGWIGCGAMLAGFFAGIFISRFADSIKRRTKSLLIVFLTGGTISGTIFTLTCENIIPFSKTLIYVSFILTGVAIVAVGPIFLELVVECTYPVPEELSTGFLMMLGNVLMLVCYSVFMLPNVNVRWANWSAVASIALGVPGLLMYRERFTRLDVDALPSLGVN